jgi:hypothetical protein
LTGESRMVSSDGEGSPQGGVISPSPSENPIASSARSAAREDGIATRVLATTTLPGKHFCNTSFLLTKISGQASISNFLVCHKKEECS